MPEENDCRFEGQRKGKAYLHAVCLVVVERIFRLNYSIHQHTGIGCDTSFLDRRNYFHTVPCMFAAALFLTASRWLNSLAYIESITDAYSQYFDNDIQHTENKHCQNYHLFLSLEQVIVSSAWSSLSYLIISAV